MYKYSLTPPPPPHPPPPKKKNEAGLVQRITQFIWVKNVTLIWAASWENLLSEYMRKQRRKRKGAEQVYSNCTADKLHFFQLCSTAQLIIAFAFEISSL